MYRGWMRVGQPRSAPSTAARTTAKADGACPDHAGQPAKGSRSLRPQRDLPRRNARGAGRARSFLSCRRGRDAGHRRRIGLRQIGFLAGVDAPGRAGLMDYFGQKGKKGGAAFVMYVWKQKSTRLPGIKRELKDEIIAILMNKDTDLKILVHRLEEQFDRELVVATVRNLLDKEEIYYKTPLLLSVKKMNV